jgi:hypothetical protein
MLHQSGQSWFTILGVVLFSVRIRRLSFLTARKIIRDTQIHQTSQLTLDGKEKCFSSFI